MFINSLLSSLYMLSQNCFLPHANLHSRLLSFQLFPRRTQKPSERGFAFTSRPISFCRFSFGPLIASLVSFLQRLLNRDDISLQKAISSVLPRLSFSRLYIPSPVFHRSFFLSSFASIGLRGERIRRLSSPRFQSQEIGERRQPWVIFQFPFFYPSRQ